MPTTLDAASAVSLSTRSDAPLPGCCALVLLKSFSPRHFLSRDRLRTDRNRTDREGLLELSVNGQHTTLRWTTDDEGELPRDVVEKLEGRPLFVGPLDGHVTFSARVVEADGKTRNGLDKAAIAMKTAASVVALIPVAGGVAAAGVGMARAIVSAVSSIVDDDAELFFEGSALADRPGDEGLGLHEGIYRLVRRSGDEDEIALEFIVHGYDPPIRPPLTERRATVILQSIDLDLPERRWTRASLPGRTLLLEAVVGGGEAARTLSMDVPSSNGRATLAQYSGLSNRVIYRGPFREGMAISVNAALVARTFVEEVSALLEATAGIVDAAVEQDLSAVGKNVDGVVQSARAVIIELLPGWKPGDDADTATRALLGAVRLLWTDSPPDFDVAVQRMEEVTLDTWTRVSVGDLAKDLVRLNLAIKLEDVPCDPR